MYQKIRSHPRAQDAKARLDAAVLRVTELAGKGKRESFNTAVLEAESLCLAYQAIRAEVRPH
jgi:hypothetical protein